MSVMAPARPAVKSRTSLPPGGEVIEAAAQAALRESSYDPVRGVECAVRDGAVILSGQVRSFYLKQIAQCVVSQRLRGAAVIENQIEVVRSE